MPPLLPQDKANHVFYGALIACVVVCLSALVMPVLRHLGLPLVVTAVRVAYTAQLVVVGFAAWKEWSYDAKHTDVHTVDPRDFAATVAGGLLVTLPAALMEALL